MKRQMARHVESGCQYVHDKERQDKKNVVNFLKDDFVISVLVYSLFTSSACPTQKTQFSGRDRTNRFPPPSLKNGLVSDGSPVLGKSARTPPCELTGTHRGLNGSWQVPEPLGALAAATLGRPRRRPRPRPRPRGARRGGRRGGRRRPRPYQPAHRRPRVVKGVGAPAQPERRGAAKRRGAACGDAGAAGAAGAGARVAR